MRFAGTARFGSVLFLGLLLAGAAATPAQAATGLAMSIDTSKPLAPTVTLTNRTGSACQVAPTALGTVGITSLTAAGTAVTPIPTDPSFPDGLDVILAGRLMTLAPGASTTFALSVIAAGPTGHAVETATWSTLGSFGQVFPIPATPGWHAVATYSVPITSTGATPLCPPGTTSVATASAATGGTSHYLLIVVVVIAVVAILIVLLLLLRRRRRPPTATVATALLLLTGAAVMAWPAHAAFATIVVTPGLQSAYDGCASVFNAPGGDPAGIFKALQDSSTATTIQPAAPGDNHEITVGGKPIILWDPADRHAYVGGGNADACTPLYHEMNHAYEDEHGGQDSSPCVTADGPSGLPVNEVNATRAQNQLRVKLGLDPRKTYGRTPLPTGPCLPKDQQPKPKGTCTGAGCGDSNGDPHLLTFDGAHYDFQAAGEFVATRDSAGGYEIQTRQQAFPGSETVGVNTATAMQVAGDRVEVDMHDSEMQLVVNGSPAALGAVNLPHGGTIAYDTTGRPLIDVAWPDGSHAYVSTIGPWGLHLTAQPAPVHAGKLTGLLGDFDGSKANDQPNASGDPVPFGTLYPAFADAHRITAAASLFTYAPGTSTATYTDRSFPHRPTASTGLPTAAAAALCRRLGITEPTVLANCTFDVAETGQAAFAETALDTQSTVEVAPEPTPGPTESSSLGSTGQEAILTLTRPNGTTKLSFPGTVGRRLYVAVESSTIPDQCGALDLLAPSGSTIAIGCIEHQGTSGGIDGTLLPTTGTYQLVLTAGDGKTGEVHVRLISSADVTGAFTGSGSNVTAIIGAQGQVGHYTFQAAAGQRVLIEATAFTLPSQCGVPVLRAPDGTTIASGCLGTDPDALDGTLLTVSGTYTLDVDPSATDTGQVTLRVILSSDQHGTIAVGGAPVSTTITTPGQVALFAFTGATGRKVTVHATASTIKPGCGEINLIGPTGSTIGIGCLSEDGTGGVDATTLETAGTYTVEVDPGSINTGSVTVTVT